MAYGEKFRIRKLVIRVRKMDSLTVWQLDNQRLLVPYPNSNSDLVWISALTGGSTSDVT